MYNANLNYGQLNEYMMFLTEKGLLRYEESTHTFRTTEKGIRFLQIYNQMNYVMMKKQI